MFIPAAELRGIQNNKVFQLNGGQSAKVADYKFNNNWEETIQLMAVKVHHAEIGNLHQSLGLKFNIKFENSNWTLGILSDTDGSECYLKEYVREFDGVNVLVLHLGSFSDKHYGEGDKHLYKKGLFDLLDRINGCSFKNNLKLVILSEFGLEMAEVKELMSLCEKMMDSLNFLNFIIFWKFLRQPNVQFHKTMFAKSIADQIRDHKDTENNVKLYASLLGFLMAADPQGFMDIIPTRLPRRHKLNLNLDDIKHMEIEDYSSFGPNWGSPYLQSLSRQFLEYIKELITYWDGDINSSLNLIMNFSKNTFNYIKENGFYVSVVFDFNMLDVIKKYIKATGLIRDPLLDNIFKTVSEYDLKDIMHYIVLSLVMMNKSSLEIKTDLEKGLYKIELHQDMEISKSILDIIKEYEINKNSCKILLSHDGLEVVFKDRILLKGIDENGRDAIIPLENAYQAIESDSLIIKKK